MVASRSKLLLLGSVLLLVVALVALAGTQLLSTHTGVEVAKLSVGGPLSIGDAIAKLSVGGPLSIGDAVAKLSVGGPLNVGDADFVNA